MSGEPVIDAYPDWVEDAFARPLSVAPVLARATEVPRAASDDGPGTAGDRAAAVQAPTRSDPFGPLGGQAEIPETAPGGDVGAAVPFAAEWASVRDANIRPYGEWRAADSLSLPVMPRAQPAANGSARSAAPAANGQGSPGGGGNGSGNGGPGHHGRPGRRAQAQGSAPGQPQGQPPRDDPGRGGKRRGRRPGGGNGNGNGGGFTRDRSERNGRFRERGPRLPGFYNPGGD